ncbi:hypothetical protein [Oceanisphaera avium]|uniref:Lipoprotein n=1 Tax=Oceanisphaera avium TaxID=1903694 RepID=A0A1Y0CVZ9_9GAMM|nr:hypothetical protein [Oceanisphaera avium]ART79409.1 hypothetical protein CBP12_03960 [Oceanisphaera avium]
MKLRYLLLLSTMLVLLGCEHATSPDDQVASVIAEFSEQADIKYHQARVDLNEDGIDDVVVLLQGAKWCGSGGCTFLVLEGRAANDNPRFPVYKILSQSTVTQAPIRVSEVENQGFKNLIVHSDGQEKLLEFDGERYPPNPSLEKNATPDEQEQAVTLIPSL